MGGSDRPVLLLGGAGLSTALLLFFVRSLSLLLSRLPRSAALSCGRSLGRLAWALSRRDRRRSREHLAIAFPDLTEGARLRIARQAFLQQGMNAAELLRLLRRDSGEILQAMEVQGWENVEAARATGRPILILTGHCSNWELLAVPLTANGLPPAAIARPADDPRVQDLIVQIRRRLGTTTIARGERGAVRQILGVLRSGGAIAMLIDQDTKVNGVWVPFFGRPAFTPVGPAEMALKQEMRVIPSFIERRPDGGHLVRFLPALDLPREAREATARMTAAIEDQVRRRPEQWVWWHKRWRRQPP